MGKYEEVLCDIKSLRKNIATSNFNGHLDELSVVEEYVKSSKKIFELATPKKPSVMIVDKQEWLTCPNCGSDTMEDYINKYDYCPSCGQSLDWSD